MKNLSFTIPEREKGSLALLVCFFFLIALWQALLSLVSGLVQKARQKG